MDVVIKDLIEMLSRMGIEPGGLEDPSLSLHRYTEHRTLDIGNLSSELGVKNSTQPSNETDSEPGVKVGDQVVLLYSDGRRISLRLTQSENDLERGLLPVDSPLGQSVLGAEEGDEINVHLDDGSHRKALIEFVETAKESSSVGNKRNGQTAEPPPIFT